jgi:hypothetical protein
MSSWKRIGAVFGFSMSAALLGVAWAAEAADSAPALDLSERAEATEEAENRFTLDLPLRDVWDRDRDRDGRCGQRCFDAYWSCFREGLGDDLHPYLDLRRLGACNREYLQCTIGCNGRIPGFHRD